MFPILIHYHLDHSSLACKLPLLICSQSNSGKPGSYHPSFIYLIFNCSILACMYSSIRIVHLYPHGKQLCQLEYSAYVQFLLPLFSQTLFISRVTQVSIQSSHFLQGSCFIHLLESLVTVCIISEDSPNLPNYTYI